MNMSVVPVRVLVINEWDSVNFTLEAILVI